MEPNYNDPNYWMRWYAEVQSARQEVEPADQIGFEQQLSELQLPGESSPETSSPDPRKGGGSLMRMQPRSNLRDSSIGDARHSVDVPRAHLGSTASDSRSDLRDKPFSSMRYTAPSDAQPVARTKDNRPRGLLSRLKSGLGKVFGGDRREESSGGSASDAVYSELRMDFAKRSRPSEADLGLIEDFRMALAGENRRPKTIDNYVTALRMFSEFLQPKGVTLKDLLGDADLLAFYRHDFMKVASANSRNYVGGALDTLQNLQAGNPISAPAWVNAQEQAMHPQDERMIRQFVGNVKDYRVAPDGTRGRGTGRVPPATIKSNVQALNAFARWLRAQDKGPLATRAFNEPRSLSADIEEYVEAGGDGSDRLTAALSHLRRIGADGLQAVGAGPRLMGRETLSAHPEDVSTLDDFLTHALSGLGSDATRNEKAAVSTMVSKLRSFSDWLQREDRPSIMDRIDSNAEQQSSLNADYAAFNKATKRTAPLDPLRQYLGLEPQQGFRAYDDDTSLIEGLANDELSKLDPASQQRRRLIQNTASAQRKFSEWLRTASKESIASRINGNNEQQRSLDTDYRAFTKAKGKVGVSLKKLRHYLQVVEANRALGVDFPQQGAGSNSGSTWSTWVRDLRPPSDFDPGEWEVRDDAQAGPVLGHAGSPRAPAQSSEIYRGLDSFVDLPSTPQEVRDDAQSRPVLGHAGSPPFFIGPSGVLQELEDIGYLVGEDWQHRSQPVPDLLLEVLDNKRLLPHWPMAPQPVSIHGETYSIELGPRGRRDAQLIHHPGPSSRSDARIGASTASASVRDSSGRVLGADEWLGDEHIQRDYELLSQELRESNPDLAARTRFVDPLVATQVGQGLDNDALRAYHRIVYDRNGNDTADFMFLPVNDASATNVNDRGSHWSFLLVDRRDRDRPVAYHYDSFPGYNQPPAARLAARVGAELLDAPIREQENSYDCGVFVLDGTRELVRRLAGTRQPDLSLRGLVVNRRALQNRVRG
ncbi:hypothetical protein BjapCC829_49445 (plasmid) [Bradyrhizobium barranii]|uniref:Ubiquitin-like protease family profile domain-containing protein n=1 Tax=Bradyrhizobium barranii TaxID=2992140 RepID=A0ABY3R296_9BRAD|nr:Ulp1 family isopeptidase [Bradyrhizobium japonicum]UFW91991.1 hypothetical protein BjapCC829_49445 [Bradyrhizobium japonicum]